MQHVVGIAEMCVSESAADTLTTYSLGSCIGLSVYDPIAGVGGMVHTMLPLSKMDPAKAVNKPCMYTDTGVAALLTEVLGKGAKKVNLIVKIAGASSMLDDRRFFRIGERNLAVVRKMMWRNGILIGASDVGGSISRTMSLRLDTGITTIKSNGKLHEL